MPTPVTFFAKTYFEGFHCWAYTSAEVATPSSPIPAALASGVINKKGTPVVMTRLLFCAWICTKKSTTNPIKSWLKPENIVFIHFT